MQMLGRTNFGTDFAEATNVTQLALHVVTQLARTNTIEKGDAQRELLQLLVRFARTGDEAVMGRLQQEMKRSRVSAEQVIDVYLPAAVKQLGNCWHDGELDILQTSVASARLQAFLRELGRAWVADQCGSHGGARILLVLPQGEQHTLGAMIAANQLRRTGVSVRMQLLPKPEMVVAELDKLSFDAVFLSISNESCLDSCQEMVDTIRRSAHRRVPVAVGGGLLAMAHPIFTPARIAAMTGADIATLSVIEALSFCGLIARTEAAE